MPRTSKSSPTSGLPLEVARAAGRRQAGVSGSWRIATDPPDNMGSLESPDEKGAWVEKSYEELVAEAREATEHVSVEEVHDALGSGGDVGVVDVRESYEWEAGHIPGARLIPRDTLEDRAAEELPDRGRRIVVHCNAGGRGALAAKSLMEMGYTNVANLEGGLNAWRQRGYEVE